MSHIEFNIAVIMGKNLEGPGGCRRECSVSNFGLNHNQTKLFYTAQVSGHFCYLRYLH